MRDRRSMHRGVHGDFECDVQKAATNLRKHGVSFEEAATVFLDPRAIDATNLLSPS